ncbi:hypothetical protein C1646_757570 [Rhizophagus diaphanus]|nr:hypothetical protein C1646_757570 [Rhizophagus diaphanus] [Rhizophagus sp. MUCL 43196]
MEWILGFHSDLFCFVKLFEFVVDNISSQKLGLSLTTLAYNSLIIPAAFNFDVESIDNQLLSLMATVILIFTILYRYFQIKPNLDLYHEERQHQRLSVVLSLFFLASLVVAVAFSAEYLVRSIPLSLVTAIGKILRTTGGFRSEKTAIFITMLITIGWQMKLTSRPAI